MNIEEKKKKTNPCTRIACPVPIIKKAYMEEVMKVE
jgi:hypothetical protein